MTLRLDFLLHPGAAMDRFRGADAPRRARRSSTI